MPVETLLLRLFCFVFCMSFGCVWLGSCLFKKDYKGVLEGKCISLVLKEKLGVLNIITVHLSKRQFKLGSANPERVRLAPPTGAQGETSSEKGGTNAGLLTN